MLGNIVNSVNGIAPVNGNVQLPEISGITMEDVADYLTDNNYQTQTDVTSYVQNEIQDFATDTDVTSYVAQELQDYALTSDLTGYAHTVDGVQAVDGVVDFNLSPNKWVKTDGAGHIATTDEIPIALSSTSNGYLYANNGSLQFKDDEYVDLSTAQNVSGHKTWNDDATFKADVMVSNPNSAGSLGLFNDNGTANIILNGGANGSFIDLNYNNGNDAFIMKRSTGLTIQDP